MALVGCEGGGGSSSTVDTGTITDEVTNIDPKYQPYDAAPISEEDKQPT